VPPPIIRMRAEDLLAQAFPGAIACPETLEGPDVEIPWPHPLVRQTLEDCLTEAMDVEGFLAVLRGLHDGTIEQRTVDTPEPSAFARGILAAQPHSFLDPAPLEERRTQAVMTRRVLDPARADELGALDPDAVTRVREEAWPRADNAEEVHEALLWMGYVTDEEAPDWQRWLQELAAAGRVVREDDRWFAAEAPRDPESVWRGRLEALGPVVADDPALLRLERTGAVLRARLGGEQAWCDRRLLARIHRYTLERLRSEIAPVTVSEFLGFVGNWQHVAPETRLEGPRGVAAVIEQLAGFPMPAAAWERGVLAPRVAGFRPQWLDELALEGQIVWGRLWGAATSPIRVTPICLLPRADLEPWLALAEPASPEKLSGPAREVHDALASRGAMFFQELERAVGQPPAWLERTLAELIGHGLCTCDSFAALRQMLAPPSRRRRAVRSLGRWSLFRVGASTEPDPEFVARVLLRRSGVVFRRTVQRERQGLPWSRLVRTLRRLELRGEVRGGRFVTGVTGEQFALPEALERLRALRRAGGEPAADVKAGDPADYRAVLGVETAV
jgi:ATP-dependent Lhr-like helicase